MKQPIIKKGDKYNKLTAIRFDHKTKRSRQFWLFRCDCGNEKVLNVDSVKINNTKSCGCLLTESVSKRRTTHGMSRTKIYRIWAGMITRCLDENNPSYKNYGGRGITICDRWLGKNGFINFYADMGDCPKGKSLDRINNDKGYYKKNCKWSTKKEQANNRRTNHLIIYNGKTQTLKQWAEELKIDEFLIRSRIKYGWSVERALNKV